MDKLTAEQFGNLPAIKKGRKPATKWTALFGSLGIGDGLIIKKEEWDLKSPFQSAIGSYSFHKNSILYGKKFKTKSLLDKSGWAILRVQ